MEKAREDYLNLLCKKLIEYYHLSEDEAREAVWNSGTEKMMHEDGTAEWQMHQPLMFTVEQIFCEYSGMEVPI